MKTILVTGASSGIGRALTVRAARAGYAVYAVGRNINALAALSSQIAEEGAMIVTDVCDVSDPENAPGLIGRMLAAFGRVDILVNNAGAVAVGPIATQSNAALQTQFGTHVIGPLALAREALPSLRASRGQIFMVGSGVARVPIGGLGAYPPSKAALRSATSILRRELAPLDIAVTYVDPGAVDTAFMSRAGLPGAPPTVLVSPEVVARKILFATGTRPRVLNVAPLQAAAVAIAELLPALTEALLERNPSLVGAGPSFPALVIPHDADGRSEKMALPSATALDTTPDELPPGGEDDDDADAPDEEIFADPADTDAPVITSIPPEAPILPMATTRATDDEPVRPASRWAYEPPEADDAVLVDAGAEGSATEASAPAASVPEPAADDDEVAYAERDAAVHLAHEDEPAHATTSFDAALEPLRHRMDRSNFGVAFVRDLLVPDAVLDVSATAMRWAGMPNKHERALTSEVFFALAEWGFLAPRADGCYRVIHGDDDTAA